MSEETAQSDTLETDQPQHWSAEHPAIAEDEKLSAFAQKFEDVASAVKSGYELERKLGSSYRLPDDLSTLSEDQKADILSKAGVLRGVPEKPEDYEIEIDEDAEPDEDLLASFKQKAHELRAGNKDAQEWVNWFTDVMKAANMKVAQQMERDAQQAETEYRMLCGAAYEQKMKEIPLCRAKLAEELGLSVRQDKDADGNTILRSALDDALEMRDVNNRALGNNPAILQLLNYVYDNLFREAEPVASAGAPGAPSGGVLSDAFYGNPERK